MLLWAAYFLVISGIMSLAALSLEGAMRPYGLPIRWIWGCALIGSLALPIILSAAWGQIDISSVEAESSLKEARQAFAGAPQPDWTTQLPIGLVGHDSVRFDGLLEALWILSSCFGTAVFVGGCWYGYRHRRHWRRATIADTELFVARDAGPAAVGLLHPEILLPEWLLSAAPETLRLVIAHERSHVEARDPGLMGLGMGCAVLMPWNAFLWWQVHRLRHAIEVDCDRRVLRVGHDARRYARTLVEVSTQRPAYLGGLAASSRSFSSIERRLIIMSAPKVRGWRVGTAGCTLFAIGVATAAILISPPAIPPVLAGITGSVAPAGLRGYIGSYQTSPVEVLQVQLRNGQLTAMYPGMKPQALTRTSGQEFRIGHTNAYIRFAIDTAGHVTGLVVQQYGAATEAPRISAVRVHAIDSAIAARVHAQTATPGSQAALRQLIIGIESGNPNYSDLSPQLAAGTRALLPKLQAKIKPLGGLRSIEFRGIDRKGWNHYFVRFERGTASWDIALDSYGIIVGAGLDVESKTHPE